MQELFNKADDSQQKKLVSDAVINLYAAHVHSLLYPYNHPLISDSLKNAFQALQKAFRIKPNIRLETAEGRLMVDGKVMDGDVFVLAHFVSWLNTIKIESLSFERELTRRELIEFHKLISTQKLTFEELSKSMEEKNILHICVQPIKFSADLTDEASPNIRYQKGLIQGYENTMFHMQSRQAQSLFFPPDGVDSPEDATNCRLSKEDENIIYQPESQMDLDAFSKDSNGMGSVRATTEGDRYAECVEALLEHDISEEDHGIMQGIPPQEMAHILNAMLFTAPGGEVVERIIKSYFDKPEEIPGEDAVERCRIFLAGLKPDLRPPFVVRLASLVNTDTLLENEETDILSNAVQKNNISAGKHGDAEIPPEPAFVPCRTIEGSDFSFDFVVSGNAVLHDIDIARETVGLFNAEHMAHLQNERVLDDLFFSLRTAVGYEEIQTTIIAECSEEVINEAHFDVVLQMLESNALDENAYRKLDRSLSTLIELYSEKGDLEKVLDLLNSLKTQSLQGQWSSQAVVMMRKIFSADKINIKIVDALRRDGRKQRESAFKLTNALRSFIIPYLLDALSEESDTSIRRFIISLLISVKSDAVDHIERRLGESSWYIIRNMLYLLRECRGRSCTLAIKKFLEHELPLVRLEALRTLLSFQDPVANDYVIKFLLSDVSMLQKGAIKLSGDYRIKNAVPHLVTLLQERDIVGKKTQIKKMIVRALGKIGDSQVVDDLLNICVSTSGLRKDKLDKMKIEIFRTLHNYPVATIGPLIHYGMYSTNEEIMAISKKLAKQDDLSVRK